MRCHEIEPLLATRRDLSVAQEQQIQSHVAGCGRCAALLRREERTDRVLRSLPSSNALPPARVQAALQTTLGRRRSRFVPRPIVAAALAALLVLVGIAFAVQSTLPLASNPNDPQSAGGLIVARIDAPPLGTLAYIQDGDLWIKPLPDGEPRRLTDDGDNIEPQWSPTGRWLLFRKTSSGQAWIVRGDGGAKQPINDGKAVGPAAWSPVDNVLAYVDIGTGLAGTLRVLNVTSGEQQPGPVNTGSIAWSPDGKYIAYDPAMMQTGDDADPTEWVAALLRIGIDGSDQRELYRLPNPARPGVDGQTMRVLGWTNDGMNILFWQTETAGLSGTSISLYAIAANGGEPRIVSSTMFGYLDQQSNSPDGALLALTESTTEGATSGELISVADLRSGKLRQLTSNDMAALGPQWSPDGERIAFYAGPSGGDPDRRRIWTMRGDGSDKRQITSDAAFRDEYPRWLDDRYLIVGRIDGQGQASAWLLDSATGKIMRVADRIGLPMDEDPLPLRWNAAFDVSPAPTMIVAEPTPDEASPVATEVAQVEDRIRRDSLYIARQSGPNAGVDPSTGEIAIVDPATKNTIAIWNGFDEVVVSRDGRRAYVANPQQVAAIDTATGAELWRTEVVSQVVLLRAGPSRLTLSPDERTLYVTSTSGIVDEDTMTTPFWLQIVDTTTGTLQPDSIELPDCASVQANPQIVTPPTADQIYLSCSGHLLNTVTRELMPLFTDYDTTQQDGRWPPFGATGAAFSPDGQTLYLGDTVALYRVDLQRPNEFVRVEWPWKSGWGSDIYVQQEATLALSGDGSRIVIARTFGTDSGFPSSTEFRVFDAQSLQEIGNFTLDRAVSAYTLTLNHDGTRLYAIMAQQQQPNNTLVEINVSSGQVITERQYPDAWITRMQIQR